MRVIVSSVHDYAASNRKFTPQVTYPVRSVSKSKAKAHSRSYLVDDDEGRPISLYDHEVKVIT